MLKKLYDGSRLWFSLAWIAAYCILMSLGDAASSALGIEKSISLTIGFALSLVLCIFLVRHKLLSVYGLCRPRCSPLLYFPLLLLLTANLWNGITVRYSATETVFYILTMFCVGFLEEVIFRGLLFRFLEEEHPNVAILVSSLTFGIGHIINLFNGSGAEFLPNLLQIVYATAAGFMFVMLFKKTGSLLPCIITHGLFNALSAFSKDAPSVKAQVISCVLLTAICGIYGIYLTNQKGL